MTSFAPAARIIPSEITPRSLAGVAQDNTAGAIALRKGPWKFIPRPERAGAAKKGGGSVQLYNLDNDLSETTNIADKHPGIVKAMV